MGKTKLRAVIAAHFYYVNDLVRLGQIFFKKRLSAEKMTVAVNCSAAS